MAIKKRRIHNPVTGKYYEVLQHTSRKDGDGQIKGLWKPRVKKR